MKADSQLHAVIDTNVVFEGLTQRGGASGLIVDAWLGGLLQVYVSNALAYEYADVLSRKLSAARWGRIRPVLGTMLSMAHFVTIHFSWRPVSPDAGDDHLVDCAMNAGAIVVSWNVRDLKAASKALGLRVITPVKAVSQLAE